MRRLALVLIAVVLAACAATGPKFATLHPPAIPEGEGRIYILRERQSLYSAYPATVEVDGEKIGSLRNGGFLMADVPAGAKTLEVSAFVSSVTAGFDLEPGQTVYAGVWPRETGLPPSLNPVGYRPAFRIVHESGVFALGFLDEATARARLPALSLSQ